MTGPEHYREAEKYLGFLAEEKEPEAWLEALRTGELALGIQAAHVHATLALADAFVAAAILRPEDRDAWDFGTGRSLGSAS